MSLKLFTSNASTSVEAKLLLWKQYFLQVYFLFAPPFLVPHYPPSLSLIITYRWNFFFIPCESYFFFVFFLGSTWAALQKEHYNTCGCTRCWKAADGRIHDVPRSSWCLHLWRHHGPTDKGVGSSCTVVESVRSKLHEGGRFGQKQAQTDLLEDILVGYDWAPSVHTVCLLGSHGSYCAGRHCKLSGYPEGSALLEILL